MPVYPLCAKTLSKLSLQPLVTQMQIKLTCKIVADLTSVRLPIASVTLTAALRVLQGGTAT